MIMTTWKKITMPARMHITMTLTMAMVMIMNSMAVTTVTLAIIRTVLINAAVVMAPMQLTWLTNTKATTIAIVIRTCLCTKKWDGNRVDHHGIACAV